MEYERVSYHGHCNYCRHARGAAREYVLEAVAGFSVSAAGGSYFIKAPVVILDDRSFEEYCEQIGRAPDLNGILLLNRIWDCINSNFSGTLGFLHQRRREFARYPSVGLTPEGLRKVFCIELWHTFLETEECFRVI